MAQVGTAYVEIQGDLSTIQSQVATAVGPLSNKFGMLGKSAVAGLAVVGAAAIGAGKALYDIGSQFDDAYDSIRVATGATGARLEGLKQDFKNVVSSVPTDFESAGDAIATLNQRLDLTGQPLRRMSKQFLELSRITGTDVKSNIVEVTKAFNNWGISTKDQPDLMNRLFRASQATGVEVAALAGDLTKGGSLMRQYGFSIDFSAALMAQFEKQGMNTSRVLAGMKIGLANFAEAGRDPGKAFRETANSIRGAKTEIEAAKIGIEAFGSRAGPEMAAAIREGRFSIGELYKAIKTGDETILGAGRSTMDLNEQWQVFTNKLKTTVEPIATKVFNVVGDAMGFVNKHSGILLPVLGALTAAIVVATVATLAWNAALWLNPIGLVVGAIAALAAGLIIAYNKSETFRNVIDTIGDALGMIFGAIMDVAKVAFPILWDVIKVVFNIWKTYFTFIFNLWKTVAVTIFDVGKSIVGFFKDTFGPVFTWLWGIVKGVFGRFIQGWKNLFNGFKAVGTKIGNVVRDIVGWIKDKFNSVLSFLSGFVSRAKNFAVKIGSAIFNGIKSGVSGLAGILSNAFRAGLRGIETIVNGAINAINKIINAWNKLPGEDIGTIGPVDFAANGLRNYKGGMVVVGEQGPELLNLPPGSDVFTNQQSRRMVASAMPTASAAPPDIRVFIGNTEIHDIVRVEMGDRDRSRRLAYRSGVSK